MKRILTIAILSAILNNGRLLSQNNKTPVDTTAIVATIKEYCKHSLVVRDIEVSEAYIGNVDLFWNDPGYKEGPTVPITSPCWIIKYTTENDTWIDEYTLSIVKNDSIAIKRNFYQRRGYFPDHGGSLVLVIREHDPRYRLIERPFIRRGDEDSSLVKSLERILKNE